MNAGKIERLTRRYEREKMARLEAEKILETKSRELFDTNIKLRESYEDLERLVNERTRELELARDEAVASVEAKSRFLANMSHEIRTPLNGVLGMLYALKNTDNTDKRDKLISNAEDSAHFLLEIINEILEFSKFESVGVTTEVIECDLVQELETVAQSFSSFAQNKKLDIVCTLDPNIPSKVMADPTRIKQLVSNLVSNAIKFTQMGHVTISACFEGGEFIDVCVSDTGIGMSKKQQERVFDAFSQADNTVTRQYGGTGLGLSICRRIADKLGAEIRLTSAPGKGSRFDIRLPVSRVNDCDRIGRLADTLRGTSVVIVSQIPEYGEFIEHFCRCYGAADVHVCEAIEDGQRLVHELKPLLIMVGLAASERNKRILASYREQFSNLVIVECVKLSDNSVFEQTDQILYLPILHADLIRAITSGNVNLSPTNSSRSFTVPNLADKKILVADDNSLNREVAATFLEETQCELFMAENGRQALQLVQQHELDLIFMDVQMPIMDGLSAAREIRESGEELPIIALTAHALPEERAKSYAAGMNGHLTKPIEPRELTATLVKYLASPTSVVTEPIVEPVPSSNGGTEVGPLPSLPGVELTKALDRFRGNWPLLKKFLITFCESSRDISGRMRGFLTEGQWEEAQRLAHQIKGSGGTFGCETLAYVAGRIEKQLKQGQHAVSADLLDQFDLRAQELGRVLDILRDEGEHPPLPNQPGQIPEGLGPSAQDNDIAALADTLADLNAALDSNLGDVQDCIDSLQRRFQGTDIQPLVTALQEAFDQFNIPEASNISVQIRKSIAASSPDSTERQSRM